MIGPIDRGDVRMWLVGRDEVREFRLAHRAELDRPGLYVLVGPGGGGRRIYVGEGNLSRRVRRQAYRKDFWRQAAVIASRSGRLNKAHTGWLEARQIELLRDAEPYELENRARAKTNRPLPYLHSDDLNIVQQFLADLRKVLAQTDIIDV